MDRSSPEDRLGEMTVELEELSAICREDEDPTANITLGVSPPSLLHDYQAITYMYITFLNMKVTLLGTGTPWDLPLCNQPGQVQCTAAPVQCIQN